MLERALAPLLPRNAVEEEVRVLRLWFMYPPRSVNCADPDIAAGVWSDTTTQDVTGLPRSNEDGVPCLVATTRWEDGLPGIFMEGEFE